MIAFIIILIADFIPIEIAETIALTIGNNVVIVINIIFAISNFTCTMTDTIIGTMF